MSSNGFEIKEYNCFVYTKVRDLKGNILFSYEDNIILKDLSIDSSYNIRNLTYKINGSIKMYFIELYSGFPKMRLKK